MRQGKRANIITGEIENTESEDAIIPELTNEQLCCDARKMRDDYLFQCDALTNRHRDQVEASLTTTLTNEQYIAVLMLKQSLRDIPQQSGFPTSIAWPSIPSFLE